MNNNYKIFVVSPGPIKKVTFQKFWKSDDIFEGDKKKGTKKRILQKVNPSFGKRFRISPYILEIASRILKGLRQGEDRV